MVAFVLATPTAKFGGDHIDDVARRSAATRRRIGWLRR
jgi:hypothetical protein